VNGFPELQDESPEINPDNLVLLDVFSLVSVPRVSVHNEYVASANHYPVSFGTEKSVTNDREISFDELGQEITKMHRDERRAYGRCKFQK
jgi:hypothetical protein